MKFEVPDKWLIVLDYNQMKQALWLSLMFSIYCCKSSGLAALCLLNLNALIVVPISLREDLWDQITNSSRHGDSFFLYLLCPSAHSRSVNHAGDQTPHLPVQTLH